MIAQNYVFKEDIAVVAPGTVILALPVVIRDMTIMIEDASVVVVNLSDTAAAYDSTYKIKKVVLNGPQTVHLEFPKGLKCSTGLCAIANNGSADIAVTYD